MTRGYYDYKVNPSGIGQFTLDGAEIAARLHSVSTFDRKGNVIYATDFSNGYGDWQRDPVAGQAPDLYYGFGYYTPVSLRLRPALSGGINNGLYRIFPIFSSTIYGIETLVDIYCDASGHMSRYEVHVNAKCSAGRGLYKIALDGTQQLIYLWGHTTGSDAWIPVMTFPYAYSVYQSMPTHLYLKFTLNMASGMYSYLTVNDDEEDISIYHPQTLDPYYSPAFQVFLSVCPNGWNDPIYIASCVVTINEPK